MSSMYCGEMSPVPKWMIGFRRSRKSFWLKTNRETKRRMQSSPNHKHRWGVILSGGDGVRLRPLTWLLTGDDRPKQFCRLVGEKTLLAQTRDRVARALPPDRTLFVLTKSHEPFYATELGEVPPDQMVVQPRNRGTLPALSSISRPTLT